MKLTEEETRLNEHLRYAATGCNIIAAGTVVSGVLAPLVHPDVGDRNVVALILIAAALHLIGHYLLYGTTVGD